MSDHQPIEERHRETMNAVGDALADMFPGLGFMLLVFEFGAHGRMNYLSNAERDMMNAAVREFLAKHEGRTPQTDLLNQLDRVLTTAHEGLRSGAGHVEVVRGELNRAVILLGQLRAAWGVKPDDI